MEARDVAHPAVHRHGVPAVVLVLGVGVVRIETQVLHAALLDPVGIGVPEHAPAAVLAVEAHDDRILEVERIALDERDDPFGIGVEAAGLPLRDGKAVGARRNLNHLQVADPLPGRRTVDDHVVSHTELAGPGAADPETTRRNVVVEYVVSFGIALDPTRPAAADDDKVAFGRTGGHEERPVLPFALAAQHDAAAVDADRAGNPVDAPLEQDRPRLRAVDRLLNQGRGIASVGWRREGFDHGDVRDGPVAPAVAHAAEVGNHVPGLLPGGHVVGLDDRIAQIGRGRRRSRSRIAAVVDPVRRTAQQPEGGQQNELMNRMIPSHLSKILWVPFHR